jgi:hypothetical protein
MGSSPDPPPNPPESLTSSEDLIGEAKKYYDYFLSPEFQDPILEAEKKYGSRYLDIGISRLLGMQDDFGELMEGSARQAFDINSELLAAERGRELADYEEYAPKYYQANRAAAPGAARMSDLLLEQSENLFAEAEGELSPERAREADQAALSLALSQGRTGDNYAIAESLFNRERLRSLLREEARTAGKTAFGTDLAFGFDGFDNTMADSYLYGGNTLSNQFDLSSALTGPQVFDPNTGTNVALMQGSNLADYQSANYAVQEQSRADRSAARLGLIGNILGAGAEIAVAKIDCWVAREVYGESNPRWIQFREWLFNAAPGWFRALYLAHGERFAKFISNKPRLKTVIYKWMEKRIVGYGISKGINRSA